MVKTKMLLGLATMVAALIVSVAPAAAWFGSDSAATTGNIKTFPELVVFKTTPTGQALECKNASGAPAGTWEIKSSAEVAAKEGPNEQLKISKWGNCTGPVSIPLIIRCSLEVKQPTKGSVVGVSGSVYPNCEVEATNGGANKCIVKVARQSNNELKEIKVETLSTTELGIGAEVSGITSTIESFGGECATLGITAGTTGTFKTKNNLVTEGQKLV